MQPALGRGHVQRVRVARLEGREVALLDVRVPGETLHVVCAGGMGVGVVDGERQRRLREAMRVSAASPRQALWRSRLEGARVTHLGVAGIELAREGNAWRAQPGKAEELLLAPSGTAETGMAERETDAAEREALRARGTAIADSLVQIGIVGRHDALRRALIKAIARVERRALAVQGDLARMDQADSLAHRAQLFVAAAATATRGARQLTATDWSTGEAREVDLTLDPARGAKEQIAALFKRARRLKEGAAIAGARLEAACASLTKLEQALTSLALPGADLDGIEVFARTAAPRDFRHAQGPAPAGSKSHHDVRRLPYRTFLGVSGARILVGRGAANNDALTLHVARPHDLWLHVKDGHGAHVVVPLAKSATCPSDLLVEAAHLAAHFSDVRDERVVEVQYTPRRYLRKPRGSGPGLVIVDREKVIVLRKDDEGLRRLLETEVPG